METRKLTWYIPGFLVSLLLLAAMVVAGYWVIVPTLIAFIPQLVVGLIVAVVVLVAFTIKHWWRAL